MKYQGSCHCGAVRFEVEAELAGVTACNCSICARKGALMWFVPRAQLALQTPESELATYTFNRHKIRHRFCPTCGIHTFGEAAAPDGMPMAAINVRCLEGIDADALPVRHFDGRAL
ncbi:MAG: GFA family protein [Rhodocyclaceae bacterium]|nr:GFA family protein [Rhodocyclaceae bacterium]